MKKKILVFGFCAVILILVLGILFPDNFLVRVFKETYEFLREKIFFEE